MKRIAFLGLLFVGLFAWSATDVHAQGWGRHGGGHGHGHGHSSHHGHHGHGGGITLGGILPGGIYIGGLGHHGSFYGGSHFGTPQYRARTPVWHDTTHLDYHAPSIRRHGNHFHYTPGHYDLHRDGHWDY